MTAERCTVSARCAPRSGGWWGLPADVKANQRRLYEDIELLFAEPSMGEVFREVEQRDRYGDRQEVQWLWASTALRGIWIGRAFSRRAR